MKQILFDFGTLDILGHPFDLRIYGYGLMLVLGFLCSLYLAKWRARRCGEDPEQITWVGMLALGGGILGARLAYVIEQAAKGRWQEFVGQDNPLWAAINISSGGLIYYGGVILAIAFVVFYLRLRKLPMRRYLDILAISLMIGLAFGRAGCFLNGCCYGGTCDERWALSQHFPMFGQPLVKIPQAGGPFSPSAEAASPAFADQFEKGLITPDRRLWTTLEYQTAQGNVQYRHLRTPKHLHGPLAQDQLVTMLMGKEQAREKFRQLAEIDGRVGMKRWLWGLGQSDGFLRGSEFWVEALRFDGDRNSRLDFEETWDYLQWRRLHLGLEANAAGQIAPAQREQANAYLQADLYGVAQGEHSHAVRPSQLVSMFNAFLLAGLLMVFFRLRRREGQVIALAFILYPITRFVEEWIRAEASQPVLTLSHNQYTSIVLLAVGVAMMAALRMLPASSGPTAGQRA